MMMLNKGDCEHCGRTYRYSLWHSGFGNTSYAYCDECGMLALLNYSNQLVAALPAAPDQFGEIDRSWEPFLRPCPCGGHFRKGASPCCPYCNQKLSATHAAEHIEAQALGAGRNWHWQNDWKGIYCIAIDNPHNSGTLLQVEDPIGTAEVVKVKRRWWVPFRRDRETADQKPV